MLGIQLIILIILLTLFYTTGGEYQLEIVRYTLVLTLCSLSLLFLCRKKSCISKQYLGVSFFFLFIFLIVNFQIGIDYAVENPNINFEFFFYDVSKISKVILLSAIMTVAYNLGSQLSLEKRNRSINTVKEIRIIRIRPLLYMLLFFFLLFLLTLNTDYVNGGHGKVRINPLSLSFYGVYWRLSIIYMGIVYYNNQHKVNVRMEKELSILFLLSLLIIGVIFSLAHNRIYIIYLYIPFIFIFLLGRNVRLNLLSITTGAVAIVFLSTLFKLFDIEALVFDFSSTLNAFKNIDQNPLLLSFSPATAELAASVYPNSIFYELWTQGFSFYGATLISNTFKVIPGLLGFGVNLFNMSKTELDTAVYITDLMNSSYGLGTNCIGDSLINIGFIPTILVFVFLGYLFTTSDLRVVNKTRKSLVDISLWLSIASLVVFIPRSSIFDLIGMLGFNLLFIYIYPRLLKSS